MIYIRIVLGVVFWLLVIAFLHYTLPQHDIVRITDTYEKRVDPGINRLFWTGGDAGSAEATSTNRDVFFIRSFRANGKPIIYRNEDTGWGWPPYFKFDTSNLQAEASDLISKKNDESPQWVAIRHYGWRSELISIFPNATKIWPVDGPDTRIIPWVKALVLLGLAAVFWAIWVRWRRFRAQRIDPLLRRD